MFRSIEIIAEVKTKSPFGFVSTHTFEELFRVANEVGDMISIHTDSRWGGSFELLERVRKLTQKPILAKGFHESDDDIQRALNCGADWVLVVGRIPKLHPEKCFIEPFTLEELKKIPENLRAVWNSRDLVTGDFKKETFEEAREIFKGYLVQASNIKTVEDIKLGANAILVGAHLLEFSESLKKVRA